MWKANYIDTAKKLVGNSAMIFNKLASVQLHCVYNFTLKFTPVLEKKLK
jgi:hypothetical protein